MNYKTIKLLRQTFEYLGEIVVTNHSKWSLRSLLYKTLTVRALEHPDHWRKETSKAFDTTHFQGSEVSMCALTKKGFLLGFITFFILVFKRWACLIILKKTI